MISRVFGLLFAFIAKHKKKQKLKREVLKFSKRGKKVFIALVAQFWVQLLRPTLGTCFHLDEESPA